MSRILAIDLGTFLPIGHGDQRDRFLTMTTQQEHTKRKTDRDDVLKLAKLVALEQLVPVSVAMDKGVRIYAVKGNWRLDDSIFDGGRN